MPPLGVSGRHMTQTDAYRAGRGLMVRLADPRRRRSRAVLLEPHHHEKSSLSQRQRAPTATAAAQRNAHRSVYTRKHRGRDHKGLPSQ